MVSLCLRIYALYYPQEVLPLIPKELVNIVVQGGDWYVTHIYNPTGRKFSDS